MNRALTTLTAALLGAASAQEIATSLPLTSVGNKLMWTVGDQDLRLIVDAGSRVQLDVYGAQFDPQDYRSADFFGDENYSTERPKAPVSSTFTLYEVTGYEEVAVEGGKPGEKVKKPVLGKAVKTQNFGAGAQDWQAFLNQDLAKGTYVLRVATEGNGKNTFAFRLQSISASVEADHLNVTVRSNDWVPALNVYNPGVTEANPTGDIGLRMYDGDGPTELEAELRDAQGNVYPIKVSGQLQWDKIDVPKTPGNYTVYLRQPKDTYQFSNTVGFELKNPIVVVQTGEKTGQLDIIACLVLPDGEEKTQGTVTVGENTYNVNGQLGAKTLLTGDYAVKTEAVKGAEVSLDKETATVINDKTESIKLRIKPIVNLDFKADKPEVCVGDVIKLTAQASTEFEGKKLDTSINIKLPEGFTTADGVSTSVDAQIDPNNPSVLTFEAKAVAAGAGNFVASIDKWGKTQNLDLKVLSTATQIELRRGDLPETVAPGDTVTVTLNLKNTSTEVAPYTLNDDAGANLEALDPTTFTGELQPGEETTLTYRARVKGEESGESSLKAVLSSNCDSSQQVDGLLKIQAVTPVPEAPQVTVTRESNVRIPFDVPSTKNANQIIIAHQPPAEANYVAGSSQLSGKPIADPQVGASGKLYWTTPGAARGILTYKVTHEGNLPALSSPTLVGKYAGNRLSVLIGEGGLDEISSLKPIASQESTQENDGALKLPLANKVFRERDRITIAVSGDANDDTTPTLNGVSIDPALLGKKAIDAAAGTQRQEFYGVPLKTGENVLSFGGESIKVFLSGSPVNAEFSPQQIIADGITPIRIGVKLTDINGITTASNTVTVQASLEPTQGDAQPKIGSYQVQLIDGEGVLELEPLGAPTRFDVRLLLGEKTITRAFEALPSKTRVGIGMVSVGAILGNNATSGASSISGLARGQGYLETPIGEGKLYAAASGAVSSETIAGATTVTQETDQGLPTTDNPLRRYANYGDSSTETIALQGIDPVAFRYEHPSFNIQYRQSAVPVDVFNIGTSPTALSGFTRGNVQLSGFAAMLPGDLVSGPLGEYEANGTRVLTLNDNDIQQDSETIQLVSVNIVTGAEESRTLSRLVDYSFDAVAGVVYFQRPLNLIDDQGRRQLVRLSYRLNDPLGTRKLAWGAQVKYHVNDNLSVSAGAVSMDDTTSFGARAHYQDGKSSADVLAAYSSGVLVTGNANLTGDRFSTNASVNYQDRNYAGLNGTTAGVGAQASVTYKLTDQLGINAKAKYSQIYNADPANDTSGGHVDVSGLYTLAPLTIGAGVRAGFGNEQGFGVVGSANYSSGAFQVGVEHVQPLSGDLQATTAIKASIPLVENVALVARDDINWVTGQRGSVGLQAKFGMTNIAANYELAGADGWGNRARFGADTALPLGDKLSLGVNGAYVLNLAGTSNTWNAGAALRYQDDKLSASIATDVAQQISDFRVTVKGGASYTINDVLTLGVDGTQVFSNLPNNTGNGSNYSVSAAARASQWQGLAYLRYKDGALAGDAPEFIGEANAEYHVPQYSIRAGVAGRTLLKQADSLTYQGSLSGTYYLNDRFGLGLAARGLVQPATNSTLLSAGIEGSFRALPGTWLTVGYNPVGFSGIGSNIYTRQGAYLRLDLVLDDGQANGANLTPSIGSVDPTLPATGGTP